MTVEGAGLTAGEMLPYVHELRSGENNRGYLVGLLLPPASSKRTVGADGVMHEEGGDRAPVSCTVDFTGLPYVAGYVQRSGKRLSPNEKIVLTAGTGEILTLLPYHVTAISVDAKTEDGDLVVHWTIQRASDDGDCATHVVRIEVADNAGSLDPDLARNVTSGADGTGNGLHIPLSETEGKQHWTVMVRDVLTGIQGTAVQP